MFTQLSNAHRNGCNRSARPRRDAIKARVNGNADRDKARAVYDNLAQPRIGEGWIWAADHDLLKRVKFLLIETLERGRPEKALRSL